MPVRISSDGTDPSSFVVTAEYLQEGKDNFSAHYYLDNGSSAFTADFKIPWDDLYAAVMNYCTLYPTVPLAEIALRFIHCYDPANATLYLRLLICQMKATTITDFDRPVHQLMDNTYQSWYELKEGTGVTPLDPGDLYDQVYLDSFMYKPVPTEALSEELSEDGGLKFARTLTFPWSSEIFAMYKANMKALDPDVPHTIYIHFASASYTAYNPGDDAVIWPHGLVMYLQDNDNVLINDNTYVSMFRSKGCDMSTLCPPKCGSYIEPPLSMQAPRK